MINAWQENPAMLLHTRLLFLTLLLPFATRAQTAVSPLAGYDSALRHTIHQYYERTADQSSLYNGNVYPYFHTPFATGTPFFGADSFRTGTMFYDGLLFENVPLLYEDLREYLVTLNQGYWLQVVRDKVDWFQVGGDRFVRVVVDSTVKNVLRTGFYRELYAGRSQVLEKTKKTVVEEIRDGVVTENIQVSVRYYIRSKSNDFFIGSYNDLMAAFADKNEAMLAFRKKKHLRYRRQKLPTILAMTEYYDQITK